MKRSLLEFRWFYIVPFNMGSRYLGDKWFNPDGSTRGFGEIRSL